MISRDFPIVLATKRQIKTQRAINNAIYILTTRKRGTRKKRFVFPRRYMYWLGVASKLNNKKLK
jgi:hypothetical protein